MTGMFWLELLVYFFGMSSSHYNYVPVVFSFVRQCLTLALLSLPCTFNQRSHCRKHLPYDDYDKWMFGPEGVWHTGAVAHTTTTSSSTSTSSSNPFKEFPDIMVIQIGHSSCLPSSDPTKTNSELHLEEQVIKDHHSQIDALFGAIKEAVERPTAAGSKTAGRTTVIVSLPGRVNLLNRKAERCVWQFNRIIAQAAHKKGFVVFEREEIEHRIGFKVESSEDLRDISVLDAAEAPTSHIVATALLSMISCLARDGVSSAATLAGAQ